MAQTISPDQALTLLAAQGVLLHCFDHHTLEIETRDGETCVCWCASDCTATCDVIFRTPMPEHIDNRDLLITIIKSMWDNTAACVVAPNGIELRCVDKTIRLAAIAPGM